LTKKGGNCRNTVIFELNYFNFSSKAIEKQQFINGKGENILKFFGVIVYNYNQLVPGKQPLYNEYPKI